MVHFRWPQHNCTCPDDYFGVGCQLERASACKSGQTWDGSFLNTKQATKEVECFIDYSPALVGELGIRLHRIAINISWANASMANVHFQLISRHEDGSSTDHLCWGDATDIDCQGSCEVVSNSASDPTKVVYNCNHATCTSCGNPRNGACRNPYDPFVSSCQNCSVILWAVSSRITQFPIVFGGISSSEGTAELSSFNLGSLAQVPMKCYTGACV